MAIYQSMQRVRFRSAGDYEQFKLIFAGVRHHLKTLPGFLHLTWWTHPDDPTWHNEVSFWTSFDALKDWHMNTYHKHAKQWAVRSGAIMEDIITNFELKSTRLIRVCPCCGHAQDKPYELDQEQHALAQPCSQCGFHFPRMPETPDSFAGFFDAKAPAQAGSYKITLSAEGWVDVAQSGHAVKASAFSGALGCEGLRKSVKFDLAAAPFTVELSGVTADSIKLVISAD